MIPILITSGDSVTWTDDPFTICGRIFGSDGYGLSTVITGPSLLELTAQVDGAGWKTSITPGQSATLGVGEYWFQSIATSATERITVSRGRLTILANLSGVAAGYDGRTTAEIALADAEKALADLHKSGQRTKQYQIGGRSATYYDAADLISAINYWKLQVAKERTASRIAAGLGNPRKMHVRFGA